MFSRSPRALTAASAVTLLLASLTACNGTADASTSSGKPTPSPTATPSATGTASASATPSPVEPEAASETEFTAGELVSLCEDVTRDDQANSTIDTASATTEWLAEVSLWFVTIPETINGEAYSAICAIGGTPEAPDIVMYGGTIAESESELRDDILGVDNESKD